MTRARKVGVVARHREKREAIIETNMVTSFCVVLSSLKVSVVWYFDENGLTIEMISMIIKSL